ncbi:ABC transporter permease [Cyclobacterium salsum]|uniref:ABC transporter permease n=1 Tax=Cyclobacterium salsum TaxID=2666329 RepID=UPI00139196DE|nr:ABC transporter permease [Cyclobacterium salsum]
MFKNHFKIAIRGFIRHKLTFFINLVGLGLGLWAAILIGLWVQHEYTIDRDLDGSEQVYRIMEHQTYGTEVFTTTSTPGILARELKAIYPEVEKAANFSWMEENLFQYADKKIRLNGFYAEADYLHIQKFDLLYGNREKLLMDKSHIVLTEDAANKLFGRTDVEGETILLNDGMERVPFVVQGILADLPSTSSVQFDYILPYQLMFDKPFNGWLQNWGSNGPSTLVRLSKESDPGKFSQKIENFINERNEGSSVQLFAFPQEDLYLHGQFKGGEQVAGRFSYVKLFALIGFFILLIACINFMNLSTAKSQKRAREVGVRKVVGAENGALMVQFLTESIFITFFAALMALLLVEISLPVFNDLSGKTTSVPYGEWFFWIQMLAIVMFTGLLAGSYPAFYLTATKVVAVFKNHSNAGKNVVRARKGLVLFQFILATILIISTLVVYQQISFALQHNLGYNKEQLLVIPLEGKLSENFEVFKNQLERLPEVKGASRSNHSLLGRNRNTGNIHWEGKDPDFTALFEIIEVDYDFLETLGMNLVRGESFSPEKGADSLQGAIINQRAYELIVQDDPQALGFKIGDDIREITGVVENFHFQSFREQIEPAIIVLDPEYASKGFVRVETVDMQNTIATIQSIAETLNPDYPFQYNFMDENYAKLYSDDVRIRELAKYFSLLAILISCLGLLGLSAHIAEQKTKEIGIRKVLGASTLSILNVINREFIFIVALSILLGSGLAYWLMKEWLSGYAYRIDFEWWIVPLSALVIFSIAFLTVTLQALRATGTNAVHALKTE